MTPLRIALVEDHPVLRDVLRDFIARLPGVEIGRVWSSAEAVLEEFDSAIPDLMLIDLSLPRMNGIDLIRELRTRLPGLCCAILTGERSPVFVRQALEVGANGYLLTGDPVEIERAIEALVAGRCYVSQDIQEAT